MLKNNQGFSIFSVLITITLMVSIVFALMNSNKIFNQNISDKKDIVIGTIDTITTSSEYLYNQGNVVVGDETLDENGNIILTSGGKSLSGFSIEEDKNISLNINENMFGNNSNSEITLKFLDEKQPNIYLGFDINNQEKNIPSYSFDNGLIISDASFWTEIQKQQNIQYQLDKLKDQKYNDIAIFIDNETKKVNKVGTYIIFDLGKVIDVNNFSFNFSNSISVSKKPKVISLTFDNGVKSYFSLDIDKNNQKIYFNEVKTRFIKLDYLLDSVGEVDLKNAINSGTPDILNNTITSVLNGNNLEINFPSVGNVTDIKYYKIYFSENTSKPINPTLTVPNKLGTIGVYYDISNFGKQPEYMWIDSCSINNICKKHQELIPKEL